MAVQQAASRYSKSDVERLLPRWQSELGDTPRQRIRTVVELLDESGLGNLAECHSAIFPDAKDPKPGFNKLIERANAIALDADVDIKLVVDSQKKNSTSQRYCWFEPRRSIADRADEFTREAVKASPGEPQILSHLRATKLTLRYFLSYAHENRSLVDPLMKLLETRFSNSPNFTFTKWWDGDIELGEGWKEEIDMALAECHFGLLLVSPEFLASSFITGEELPIFVSGKKPCISVGLSRFDFEATDTKGLTQRQIFLHQRKRKANTWFEENRQSPNDSDFATELAKRIESRIRKTIEQGHIKLTDPVTPESSLAALPESQGQSADTALASEEESGEEFDEFLRKQAHDPDIGHLERSRAQRTSLKDAIPAPNGEQVVAIDFLSDWADDENASPYFALLGEYGIGKTTTLKHFARNMLDRRKDDSETRRVIYLDLRRVPGSLIEQRGDQLTLEDILSSTIKGQWDSVQTTSLTPGDLIHLVRNGRAIIVFDGLDEVTVKLSSSDAQQFIRQLWSVLPPTLFPDDAWLVSDGKKSTNDQLCLGRVVISCRSHYFKDLQQQTNLLLGERRESVRAEHYQAAFILPFNDEQIRNYLKHTIGEEHLDRTLELISEVHNLKELAERPYLLNLITGQLPQLERMKVAGETVNGATLYRTMTREWLERDDGKHHIPEEDKRLIMEQLALDMWVDGNRFWKWERLYQWLRDFFRDHPEIRQACGNVSNELLEEDLRTATFILRPDDEEQRFRFAHTSLQEFFLASLLHRVLLEAGRLKATGKPAAKINEVLHCWNIPVPSVETLEFLGQLIETDDEQPRTVQALATLLEGSVDVERPVDENAEPSFGNNQPSAALVAFRYWLLAVEKGLPEPATCRVCLSGLDLSHLEIRGRSTTQRLALREADFSRCNLVSTKFRNVDLSGASLSGVRGQFIEFLEVDAAGASVQNANLSGLLWRGGDAENLSGVDSAKWSGASLIGVAHVDDSFASRVRVVSVPAAAAQSRPLPGSVQASLAYGHTRAVMSCGFSTDGRAIVSAGDDQTVRVWDAESGQLLRTLAGHTGAVNSCSFSTDGRAIVSAGDDQTVRVWDAESGQLLRTLAGHTDAVRSCGFSTDGRAIVSAGDDQTVRVWDADSGQLLRTLEGHTGGVNSCCFSTDGRAIVSAGDDQTVRVWDADSGQLLRTLAGHRGGVRWCGFSTDGRAIVSAGDDQTVRVWDADSGQLLRTLAGHMDWVNSCGFSTDGRAIVSAGSDQTVRVWDAESGQLLRTLAGHTSMVNSCGFSTDGRAIVSAGSDQTVRVWDAESGQLLRTLAGHTGGVRSCGFSTDDRAIVSAGSDQTVRVWDADSGQLLRTLAGHTDGVRWCGFSTDGRAIVSAGDDQTVRVWDADSGQLLRTLEGHTGWVNSCGFSTDGRAIVSAGDDQTVRVWDAESGQLLRTLAGHTGWVLSCGFSTDGRAIVSAGDDQTVRVWDAESGQLLRTLAGHTGAVNSCSFSTDGRAIVSAGDDQTVRVWDADSGQLLRTLAGHTDWVNSCSFSTDGRAIVSAGDDQTVRVWDAESGQLLRTLAGHTDWVRSCGFSTDGRAIVSASSNNTVSVWDVSDGFEKATESMVLMSLRAAQAAVDRRGNRILWASENAWRYLGWEYNEETTGRPGLLPAEHFGPLPTSPDSPAAQPA